MKKKNEEEEKMNNGQINAAEIMPSINILWADMYGESWV